MSVYNIVFLLLLGGTIIEYNRRKSSRVLFVFCFSILTCMLCFRFAQGTDYSAYRMIYYTIPRSISGALTYSYAKAEVGWRLLCMIFRIMNLPFPVFVVFIAAVDMAMLWRYITRFCQNRMFALFLGFHTLYFTYIFSAFRQGVVIMVFLGLLLQWLIDGKILRYLIGVALLTTIHSVALILFVPVILRVLYFSVEQILALVIIGFCLGSLLSIFGVGNLMALLGMNYSGETQISLFALSERIISFVVVSYMYYFYVDGKEPKHNDTMLFIYKLYAFGIFLYCVLMWSPLISSRTIYVFKVLEIPLITTCIMKCGKSRMLILLYCVVLCTGLYLKNIAASISQGVYMNTSVWNYPYFTIFNVERVRSIISTNAKYFEWLFITR